MKRYGKRLERAAILEFNVWSTRQYIDKKGEAPGRRLRGVEG